MQSRSLIIGTAVAALGVGLALGLVLGGDDLQAQAGGAQQSAATVVDRCCFDLDGGGKADDGIFSVNLKGEMLLALVYEDPDGNKKFEDRDEIKAASLGNLVSELKKE
jgi:hypothetical protein